MSEEEFVELFSIGQGLPGPTSTQLVVSTAMSRAGVLGGLCALFMWNLPGLIFLTVAGVLYKDLMADGPPFWLAGLAPAAISMIFQAFYGFVKNLDKVGQTLSLISCMLALLINGDNAIPKTAAQWVYPLILVCGSLFTLWDSYRGEAAFGTYPTPKGWDVRNDLTFRRIGIPLHVGALIFVCWGALLIGCFIYRSTVSEDDNGLLPLFETMYRVGSIIFGGGQVVLPMLYDEVVTPGWISDAVFYQGFALASALPGPLFNFAAFVGAAHLGVRGALVAYVGLFAPGVILIFAMVSLVSKQEEKKMMVH
jgi:chromate transporter